MTGLFRLSGAADKLAEMKVALDSGDENPFWRTATDHGVQASTVADMIGFYLRELPEPIVPAKQYAEFLAIVCTFFRSHSFGGFGRGLSSLIWKCRVLEINDELTTCACVRACICACVSNEQ